MSNWREKIDAREMGGYRLAAASSALSGLGLDFDELVRIAAGQIDDFEQVLLTSSSVQGLSTFKSDIDLIGIASSIDEVDRAPAQLFLHDRRFELIVFSRQEVENALATLGALSKSDTVTIAQTMRYWDRTHVVRQKYVERLVNGVCGNLTVPYIDMLPLLAAVWLVLAFDKARQFVICSMLARRAAERQSHRAYSLRSVIHMMDMVLSAHGFVYSNVKWIPLRWAKFRRESRPAIIDPALLRSIDELWTIVLDAYLRPSLPDPNPMLPDLFIVLCHALALDPQVHPRNGSGLISHKGTILPFCGDMTIGFDPAGLMNIIQTDAQLMPAIDELGDFAKLPAGHARALLRGSRARLIDFSLSAPSEEAR